MSHARPIDIPPCDHSPDDCPPIEETDMTTDLPTETWCTPPMGIANESPCLLAPMHYGQCEPPMPTHPNAEGADADAVTIVQAQFRDAVADAGVANPEQYTVAYDTTPLRPIPKCDTACRCHHDDLDW